TLPEELVSGIRAVVRGEGYLSPSITGVVVDLFRTTLSRKKSIAPEKFDVLASKLHKPDLTKNHVHRQRLMEKLDDNRQLPLQLIIAPAGFGKSTLASCWISNNDWPSCWFSIDETDNSVHQFLLYFTRSVQSVFPDSLAKTNAFLGGLSLPPTSVIANSLINDIEDIGKDFMCVLDDVHLIREKSIQGLLSKLLQNPPSNMHLLLIGRMDPFLPIVSLRAEKKLHEIRLHDLKFTEQETGEFLQRALGYEPDQKSIVFWTEKSEGWITCLHLAILSMRHQGDLNDVFDKEKINSQYVMEYLFSEILAKQDPLIRQYLLRSSILDRFCAPLCEAVCYTGQDAEQKTMSGGDFIRQLQSKNLFIINLDNKQYWFRHHHLFQQLLSTYLAREFSQKDIADFHSRASEWFAKNNYIEEAITHALAAEDVLTAAKIVEQNRNNALDKDQWYTLKKWLDRLPHEIKQERLALLLSQARILLNEARVGAIVQIIERVQFLFDEDTMEPELLSEINFFRGIISYFQGEGEQSKKHFIKAMELLPKVAFLELRAEIFYWSSLALHLSGLKEDAFRQLYEGIRKRDLSEAMILTRLVFGLCFIHMLEGESLQAFAEGHKLREISRINALVHAETWAMYVQGNTSFQMFELDDARHHFSQMVENQYIGNPRAVVDAMAGLALSCQFMGKEDEADEALKLTREYAKWTNDFAHLELVDSCHARLALMRGDIQSATRWQRTLRKTHGNVMMLFFLEIPVITECRVLIAAATDISLQEAGEKLEILLQQSNNWKNKCQKVDLLILKALVRHGQGQLKESLKVLQEAVNLAEYGRMIRPFAELGLLVFNLLKKLMASDNTLATNEVLLIKKILSSLSDKSKNPLSEAISQTYSHGLIDPLTKREIEILNLLKQRYSNQVISEKLFISTETVKSHLKSIYSKFSVGKCKEAVAKAYKLGLFEL
ncbi:MAG: LuxR C-terminal-related transcriptional regulator, partial [Xanthomonadales bacterium]|nr:LuxR C-terminal-related transcriptional regulator [Xanthomonadales bacterium]